MNAFNVIFRKTCSGKIRAMSLVLVFLKITLKTFLKVLLCILGGFAILMRNSKSVVQNI